MKLWGTRLVFDCDLSQWIHLELSAQRQRQADLCDRACSLMNEFAEAGRHLQGCMGDSVLEKIASNLGCYICNVAKRAVLLKEMDSRWEATSVGGRSLLPV